MKTALRGKQLSISAGNSLQRQDGKDGCRVCVLHVARRQQCICTCNVYNSDACNCCEARMWEVVREVRKECIGRVLSPLS
jgi:hypothetical protein